MTDDIHLLPTWLHDWATETWDTTPDDVPKTFEELEAVLFCQIHELRKDNEQWRQSRSPKKRERIGHLQNQIDIFNEWAAEISHAIRDRNAGLLSVAKCLELMP